MESAKKDEVLDALCGSLSILAVQCANIFEGIFVFGMNKFLHVRGYSSGDLVSYILLT